MEHSENKISQPAQITLILRLVAGAYLVYLAFGLMKDAVSYSGQRQILLIICIGVFMIVGVILGGWTIKKLIKGEFLRAGETEDPDDEDE